MVWLGAAVLGTQLVDPVPLASRSVAALVYQDATQIPVSLRDRAEFEAQASVDAFRDTPNDQLLTGLKGKDVVLDVRRELRPLGAWRTRATRRWSTPRSTRARQELKSAGFAARSGFLTSPVAGGGSWLAHATFGSGLWIGNQQRDRSLVSSDRLTLTSAFQKAGWDTTAIMPGTIRAWPDANFYGIDRVYGRDDLGYKGLNFSWSPMPDQYTLAQFQQREYGKPGRAPMMAEVVLTSSHVPWTPVPEDGGLERGRRRLGLRRAGEGGRRPRRGVAGQRPGARGLPRLDRLLGRQAGLLGRRPTANDNLVLVFLGDHQPAPIITGDGASRDVPVTIVAKDPAVLDRIAGWGWTDGLRPAPQAPVWRMDAFRDRFLTAFGPHADPSH